MPAYFFDTNALIKAYVHESGSPWVNATMTGKPPSPIYISELARVEVPSALYKVERIRAYSQALADSAINRFHTDMRLSAPTRRLKVFEIVLLSDQMLTLADALLRKYRTGKPNALRSLDAIQLASAVLARSGLPTVDRGGFTFVTVDRQLSGVAAAEGFLTTNPEHPPSP